MGSSEIISLHVGQTGVRIGNYLWPMYCYEHQLTSNGHPDSSTTENSSFEKTDRFFHQEKDGRYTPRAILVDTDPACIG